MCLGTVEQNVIHRFLGEWRVVVVLLPGGSAQFYTILHSSSNNNEAKQAENKTNIHLINDCLNKYECWAPLIINLLRFRLASFGINRNISLLQIVLYNGNTVSFNKGRCINYANATAGDVGTY